MMTPAIRYEFGLYKESHPMTELEYSDVLTLHLMNLQSDLLKKHYHNLAGCIGMAIMELQSLHQATTPVRRQASDAPEPAVPRQMEVITITTAIPAC